MLGAQYTQADMKLHAQSLFARPGPRAVVSASVVATIGVLPVFLLGALAVLIRADLAVTEGHMGVAVATFFGTAAVTSVHMGRLVEHLSAPRALALGASSSGLALAGLATTGSYGTLLAWMAAAGVATNLSQLGANLKLSGAVPAVRQGQAFGIKQAAIPGATLVAGVAVPTIALTVGWRWVFVVTAVTSLVVAVVQLRGRDGRRTPRASKVGAPARLHRPSLAVLAAAAGFGTATATAMGAFLVEYTMTIDIDAGVAGWVLGIGGLSAILSRIAMGSLADRREGGNLLLTTGMMAIGAVAVAAFPHVTTVVPLAVLTVLAYAIGWGWAGLFNFAIVRRHRHAPAAATGITQIGVYAGGVTGPIVFGLIVTNLGYEVAWSVGGAAMLSAAGLMAVGRSMARRSWHRGDAQAVAPGP